MRPPTKPLPRLPTQEQGDAVKAEELLEEKVRTRRCQIADEMYQTEKTYFDAIVNIIEVYGKAFEEASPKLVPPGKSSTVLGNIAQVLQVSSSLLHILKERCIDGWSSRPCVGDVWLQYADRFDVYQTYIRGHRDAIIALDSMDAKKDFAKWMKEIEEQNPGVKALGNLLIMPVQRMPRYVLLIHSLLDKTPPQHPDHEPLKAALAAIEKVVTDVNDAIERQENWHKLYEIARKLGAADLMSEDRLYFKDGNLMKICRKQPKERWFVLCSDILIYGAFDPTKLSMKYEVLRLDRTVIEAVPDPRWGFQIRSEQKSFVVYGASEEEREQWMNALHERIKACGGDKEDIATAPVWTPDKKSAKCTQCPSEFTVINRRHHCRKCGALVCGKCSSFKMIVPNIDAKKPVRVCDKCLMSN